MKKLLLKLRFRYFKSLAKKADFSKRKLIYENNCTSLHGFNVKLGEFYNDNDVWFDKDAVSLTGEGINIKCYKDYAYHESWNGKKYTNWTSGMIDTCDIFMAPLGVWEFEVKTCNSWPAIWLLKKGRQEPGYKPDVIIPEIDVYETMQGMMRHTVHYGYSDIKYARTGIGSSIAKCGGDWHKFTVELLDNGYRFYIDDIMTAEFINDDPEFVTKHENYLLLNNAAHTDDKEDTNFIIRSIKFYE